MSQSDEHPPARRILAFDIHGDLEFQTTDKQVQNYRIDLTKKDEALLIGVQTLMWVRGTAVVRKFTYESMIINAFFVTFNENNVILTDSQRKNLKKVLVVVLKDQLRVYENQGKCQTVTLPFFVKNAFSFENGIIINKEPDSSANSINSNNNANTSAILQSPLVNQFSHNQQQQQQQQTRQLNSFLNFGSMISTSNQSSNEGNFLTLLDPLGELGSIVSSSTTSFSSKEEIISFPKHSSISIAVAYNPVENLIIMYHTRYLSRSNKNLTNPTSTPSINRKQSKRSISMASDGSSLPASATTPSATKIIDDADISKQFRFASGSEMNSDFQSHSSFYNYNQPHNNLFDAYKLRKDIIFSRITTFESDENPQNLKIFNVSYKDKESVVICNLKESTIDFFIFQDSGNSISKPTFRSSYNLKARDAVPLNSKMGHKGYIVILYDEYNISLVNPFLGIVTPALNLLNRLPPVKSLQSCNESELVLLCDDDKHYSLHLALTPQNQLVQKLMEMMKYLSSSYVYEYFWIQWSINLSLNENNNDDWETYITTLLSLIIPDNTKFEMPLQMKNDVLKCLPSAFIARRDNSSNTNLGHCSLTDMASLILLSLHLIREDLRLNILLGDSVEKLSVLLAQISSWCGWSEEWISYYRVDPKTLDKTARFLISQPLPRAPNLLESLASLFSNKIVPYITFAQVSEEDDRIDEIITPRTYYILRLFEAIMSNDFGPHDVVSMMVDYNLQVHDLETFPAGVFLPLKNIIVYCQNNPSSYWIVGSKELELIERKDLLAFSESSKFLKETNNIIRGIQNSSNNVDGKLLENFNVMGSNRNDKPREMVQILQFINSNEMISAWDGQAEADRNHVTKLIFCEDRRFYELTRLLQTSKVQTATLKMAIDNPSLDEEVRLTEQRLLATKVALKTLTVPLGRAAIFLSSKKPLMTERFPISKMNLNAMILPDMFTVTLDKDKIDKSLYDWGFFHNGASAGLMVSRNSTEISGSWIVFNKPPILNPQHAGFLLGLGLNGHLRKLEEWHIYNYLGPKHNYTSVGLLLGMSASLKGTMDVKLTKVLSVHVVALLPIGSSDLNVPLSVQTAGLIGIGLLYLETQHRRMTEVLLTQISANLVNNDMEYVNEGYRLASGIALGYINLGKGQLTKDSHVIDQLLSLAISIRDTQTPQEFDKSCGGAIMALMFMFLKTNNYETAAKLSLPSTVQLLDYIRPDFLMLRCLCKNMIMWDNIRPTRIWINSQIPVCLRDQYDIKDINLLDSDNLPYINVIGGLCLSIGVRYASSSNLIAKESLIYYLDQLMRLSLLKVSNYDSKISLINIRNIRDIVSISLSLVMAGSGDLDTFKRLRVLQGFTDSYTNYGNYMAINTALGFLFLGGGQQAFKSSNFGIASLITSIYPVYNINNSSNENGNNGGSIINNNSSNEIHLQALRHFWALSVEPRCLIIRDVITKEPLKIDVLIELNNDDTSLTSNDYADADNDIIDLEEAEEEKDDDDDEIYRNEYINESGYNNSGSGNGGNGSNSGTRYIKLCSPCLLPPINTVKSIKTINCDEYYPVRLEMNKSQLKIFKLNYTIFVYNKAKYQDLSLTVDEQMRLIESDDKVDRDDKSEDEIDNNGIKPLNNLEIFKDLNNYEINLEISNNGIISSIIDFKIEVELLVKNLNKIDDLWNLKLIFEFVNTLENNLDDRNEIEDNDNDTDEKEKETDEGEGEGEGTGMIIDNDYFKSSNDGSSSGSKLVLNSNTTLRPDNDYENANTSLNNTIKGTSIGIGSNRKRVVFGTRTVSSSSSSTLSSPVIVNQSNNNNITVTPRNNISKSKKIKNIKKNSNINNINNNNINNLNYLNFKFIENLKTKLWLKLKEMNEMR